MVTAHVLLVGRLFAIALLHCINDNLQQLQTVAAAAAAATAA